MKYFAHFGHTDFILCLGHKGEAIKEYFLRYDETLSNDFVLSDGGREIQLMSSDIQSWRITFADTGLHSSIGGRMRAVRKHLGDDEMFLATYGDGVTDEPLNDAIEETRRRGKIASFIAVRPSHTFHIVRFDDEQVVQNLYTVTDPTSDVWINGGFFIFRREIFDYMQEGEDLVEEPFRRLVADEQLLARRYEGFWSAMDTLKDKQILDTVWESGEVPWRVWEGSGRDRIPVRELAP
jgi:glucose-1-phosphate cytidylyltransferase